MGATWASAWGFKFILMGDTFCWQEWLTEAEAVEEVQIMEELPHSLRREIAYNINKKIFRQLAIFHDFPLGQQAAICGMMTPLQA